jgi:hypothetical protein
VLGLTPISSAAFSELGDQSFSVTVSLSGISATSSLGSVSVQLPTTVIVSGLEAISSIILY